jgi:hypothetical protein
VSAAVSPSVLRGGLLLERFWLGTSAAHCGVPRYIVSKILVGVDVRSKREVMLTGGRSVVEDQ